MVAQIVCWTGQFIGHGVFEVLNLLFLTLSVTSCPFCLHTLEILCHDCNLLQKRAPALLDNLAQAFLMAPFFVLLEVILMDF